MRDLFRSMSDLNQLSAELNDNLCAKFNVGTSIMPVAGLNMVGNRIVMVMELLSHYAQAFPRPLHDRFDDHMNAYPEETRRIIDLLTGCFVSAMSSLESCARKTILSMPGIYGVVPNKIYLINIVERSRKLGWLSNSDELMWKNFIELRNSLVHNNGEGQSTNRFSLPSGLVWSSRPGAQTKVTLRHIPETLEWIIKSYAGWCDAILCRWAAAFDYTPRWNKIHSYKAEARLHPIPGWGFDSWSNSGAWSWTPSDISIP